MKFDQITHKISLVMLLIAGIYTLAYSGITGVLFVSAIGFIISAFVVGLSSISIITIFDLLPPSI